MLKALLLLSLRSLEAHRLTTFVVGSIIFFGTWLGVCATAVVGSLERSLAQTLVSSVAGHLQVYSSQARDDLALFGSGFSAVDDVGQMSNFAKVRDALLADEGVKAVVPMGIAFHAWSPGNDLDQTIAALRSAAKRHDAARIEVLSNVVQSIAEGLEDERQDRLRVASDVRLIRNELAILRRVRSPRFWQAFRSDPSIGLQFLDTRVAPLAGNAPPVYLRDIGSDLQAFTRNFSRFHLCDGAMVPPGERGYLIGKQVYETQLKHPVARAFDELHAGLAQGGRSIAQDPLLHDEAKRLPAQVERVTFQLDPGEANILSRKLRSFLSLGKADIAQLLREFLQVEDNNFAARHAFFYEHIAPLIRLYDVHIGDNITLQAITHAGYHKSVQVRVAGTFEFIGLDQSSLVSSNNLMDMLTFRELYGARSKEQDEEIDAIRRSVHVADIDRDAAEAQMFTDTHVRAERTVAVAGPTVAPHDLTHIHGDGPTLSTHYTQQQLDEGLALNAAVILHDGQDLATAQARLSDRLAHAGLPVRIVDWRAASGLVSNFLSVINAFLYAASGLIFLIGLVIMSNAMTMATAARARELGTIRAIGGHKSLVLGMYLFETLTLGLSAGTLGALAAYGTIGVVHERGITAVSDVMTFLFSGPRFYPTMIWRDLGFGMLSVLLVTIFSVLYPARVAVRIAPAVAMMPKE